LPLPTACKDKDPTICTAIFAVRSGAVAPNSVATNPFLVNPNCQNVTVMVAAEALCPSSCAVCCLTPEFNCQNSTTAAAGASACSDSRANCAQMASFCNTPPYSAVMAQQCRRTCNLCQ
uniref:ShKT domain-containing protein n=1 Tax=Dracunculus medinensis TaxID=318479 RepID=A0A0N4UFZ8_DRAME